MRIFLACHSYFGKCKVRCPLLIPLLGLMLSMRKSAEDGHFYEFARKYGNPAEKAHLHPWDCASSLPTLQRSFNVSFPSQALSVHADGRQACLWCTLCTAEGEFKLLTGPHTQMVHKGSQDEAQAPPMPLQVPTGHLCQGCALLLWRCASLILTATDLLGCV